MPFSTAQTPPGQRYYADVAGQLALEVHGKSQTALQHLFCTPDGAENPTFLPPQKEMTRSGLLPCYHPNLEPLSSLQNPLSHKTAPGRLQEGKKLQGPAKNQTGQHVTVPW